MPPTQRPTTRRAFVQQLQSAALNV